MPTYSIVLILLMFAATPLAAAQKKPGDSFTDCRRDCPAMIVVPAGSAVLGSTDAETTREGVTGDKWVQRDKPQYRVTIARPFAIGKYEITVAEYRRFVRETRRRDGPNCWIYNPAATEKYKFEETAGIAWRDFSVLGHKQVDRDPVACVSWDDATAYAKWLSTKTGRTYRLPSEGEWEYAARAGSTTARYWGDGREQACAYSNIGDRTAAKRFAWRDDPQHHFMCEDGYAMFAPVGSFKPNAFGLFDVQGNIYEWTQDCFAETNAGQPIDGGARTQGDCAQRSLRGGGFGYYPHYVRTSFRIGTKTDYRSFLLGFRLVREVE